MKFYQVVRFEVILFPKNRRVVGIIYEINKAYFEIKEAPLL